MNAHVTSVGNTPSKIIVSEMRGAGDSYLVEIHRYVRADELADYNAKISFIEVTGDELANLVSGAARLLASRPALSSLPKAVP